MCSRQTATTVPFNENIVDFKIPVDRVISWKRAPTLCMEAVGYNWPLKFINWQFTRDFEGKLLELIESEFAIKNQGFQIG